MSTQEEKLSLMSSLSRTWSLLSELPEDRLAHRWDGLQLEVEGSTVEVDRIEANVQRLSDTAIFDKGPASREIQSASVKLSGHIICGTDIAIAANNNNVGERDAVIAREWTEAVRFVDRFCQDSQKRIEALSQSQTKTAESTKDDYSLGLASGSLGTASQVARQQYERGTRMSLQGPLAEYAAASALENGLAKSPDGPVFGVYRAMHQRKVIVESIPDGQFFAVPVDAEAAKALRTGESNLRGKPVVYAQGKDGVYAQHEPVEFAAECRERAAGYAQAAEHQDGMKAYRQYLDASSRLLGLAGRIDEFSNQMRANAIQDEGRASNSPVSQPEQTDTPASSFGRFALDMIRRSSNGSMPQDVLLYALASHAQDCVDKKLDHDFLDKLHLNALSASEKMIYEHMMSETPIPACGMTVLNMEKGEDHWREATALAHYHAGSVLRGSPQQPREYRVYQDKTDPGHIVLASETPEKEMHVMEKNFSSNHWHSSLESFRGDFSLLDPAEAEDALVKFFGCRHPETTLKSTQGAAPDF